LSAFYGQPPVHLIRQTLSAFSTQLDFLYELVKIHYFVGVRVEVSLGTVVDVKNSVTKKNGHTSTFLICNFILSGDVMKRVTLNIRSVKAGPPPG
jgi:hypothetical protein